MTINPFEVRIFAAELDDLRRRARAARRPEKETVPLAAMRKLARRWGHDYDFTQIRSPR
jgi:transposase InsO family protein